MIRYFTQIGRTIVLVGFGSLAIACAWVQILRGFDVGLVAAMVWSALIAGAAIRALADG